MGVLTSHMVLECRKKMKKMYCGFLPKILSYRSVLELNALWVKNFDKFFRSLQILKFLFRYIFLKYRNSSLTSRPRLLADLGYQPTEFQVTYNRSRPRLLTDLSYQPKFFLIPNLNKTFKTHLLRLGIYYLIVNDRTRTLPNSAS